jgi:hypothetical protein
VSTSGNRYYLPYLDIPLSEKISIDSYEQSFYLQYADNRQGKITIITNGSILVPFKDGSMFLSNGILQTVQKIYCSYDRGILDNDYYVFCKEMITRGQFNHHMHRH